MVSLNAGLMSMLKFFFTMFIATHITGCVWVYMAKLDDFGPGTWVFEMDIDQSSMMRLYIWGMYWAISTISTVGFGDIHAYNSTEVIFSMFWMIFGVIFYSFTIGNLTQIMNELNEEKAII